MQGVSCRRYIHGIADLHETFTDWKRINKEWCLPDKINSDQLVRVVVKHLQKYPEDLHMTASGLVANAFIEAFPCEEGETI
jgi:hypothetical protein